MAPRRAAAAALLALYLAAGACRQPPSPPAPGWVAPAPPAQVLRFNLGGDPATLDPAKAGDAVSTTVMYQLYEGLTRRAPNGTEPGIAERWEVSLDGRRYVFHLREAYWSDGTPLTAADFEFAWKRVLDPATGSPYASPLFFLRGAAEYHGADRRLAPARLQALREAVGVRAVDSRTLEVELADPAPFFPELASTFPYLPVPRHKVSADPEGWWAGEGRLASNGPFRLEERGRGRLVLVKNELYWDRRSVALQRVVFSMISDPGEALSAYEAGDIDAAMPRQLPLAEVPRLLSQGQARQAPLLATYYLVFNTTRPPFHDPRVRRAFSLAIDRRALVEGVLQGLPRPALALVPPGIVNPASGRDFRDEGGDYLRDADVAAARSLLAAAGYPEGRGFPRVMVLFNNEGEQREIMLALQEMWREHLGVEVQLVGEDWQGYRERREAGDFHLARVAWIGEYADPAAFLSLFRGDDPRNFGRWRSAVYDELLARAQASDAQGPRLDALHRAEALLLEDSALAPLYFYVQFWLQRDTVEGLFVDLQGNAFFRSVRIVAPASPGPGKGAGAGG